MTKLKFLEKARFTHGYKYNYLDLPEKILQNDYLKIEFEGNIFEQKVLKHLIGKCPEKTPVKNTTEDFIQKAKIKWGDKYDYSITNYINAKTKIKIIHNGIIYEQLPNSHLKYPVEGFLDNDVFMQKAKQKWGNKYDYSLVNFISSNVKVKIKYGEIIYEQTPHNHLKYAPEKVLRKTQEEFINECKLIHDNKYNYDKTIYILDRIKVNITCPEHGNFEQLPNHHKKGVGCPSCNESKGEKKISSFLKKNKINFDRQKKFKNCKNIYELPFDFYIPSKRTCIEFDGKQHFEPLDFFGGLEAFEKLKINDDIKNNFCEDNYINLIRIKYTEIDKIDQLLKNYF
jgi:very-short-patch-repair endonuclease